MTDDKSVINIFDLYGKPVTSGVGSVTVPSGIYIAKTSNATVKVIVTQ